MPLSKVSLFFISIFALSSCATNNEQALNVPTSVLKTNQKSADKVEKPQNVKENDVIQKYMILEGIKVEEQAKIFESKSNELLSQLSGDENIQIAINEMQLNDFIHLIYGEHLGLSYVLDESISKLTNQTMTLNLQDKVSQQKLFSLSTQLLAKSKVQFDSRDSVLFFFVNKQKSSKGKFSLGVGREQDDIPVGSDERIAQLVPILYTDWDALSQVVGTLINIRTRWLPERNAVLAIGNAKEVGQFLRIINTFDLPNAKNKFIALHEFTYINVEEFISQLTELLLAEGIDVENKNARLVFTPLLQRNAVIVHSVNELILKRIGYWTKILDKPSPTSKKRYYTFNPENANVDDIGESIGNLIALQNSQVTPYANAGSKKSADKKPSGGSQSNQQQATASKGVATDDLSMMIDQHQNALIFYTTPAKYHEILPLLQKMDLVPKQVVIEATIASVTLGDSYQQGIEWFLNNTLGESNVKKQVTLDKGITFSVANFDYSVVLQLLESESKLNILSNPRLVVKNGESASLNVGQQVPILTQQSSNANGDSDTIIQSVQYSSTGVSLGVTPTISGKGVVSLAVTQTVSSAQANTLSEISSPVIANRSITTTVLARSGQTVVLGGLIQEDTTVSSSGVPFFQDIPIIGNLFISKSEEKTRSELIILLTPKVLSDGDDIENLIRDYSRNSAEIKFN
ncbi:hypothetical protein A9Q74_10480 [Colwellia sp. 39_35_sub15_T18]|nr:hypothetical protein A9Q74_10480 [Colwellia sp. 39_35_sub15_T18]